MRLWMWIDHAGGGAGEEVTTPQPKRRRRGRPAKGAETEADSANDDAAPGALAHLVSIMTHVALVRMLSSFDTICGLDIMTPAQADGGGLWHSALL